MMDNNAALNAQPVAPVETGEKLVPQSQVNAIVAAEKDKAYQKGVMEGQSQLAPAPAVMPQAPAPAIDIDEIAAKAALKMQKDMQDQKARDEAERKELEMQQQATATLQSLQKKLDGIKERMPDWQDTVEKGGLSGVDAVWALADQVDNPGEVVYELSKNPDKAIMLMAGIQTGNLQAAQNYIQTLSAGLKANDAAKNAPKLNTPLDKITPSSTSGSGGSTTDMSVSDWKKRFATQRR